MAATLLASVVGAPGAGAQAGGDPAKQHHLDELIRIALVESHGSRITDARTLSGTQGSGAVIEHDTAHGATYRGTDTSYYANVTLHGRVTGRVGQGPGGVRIFFGAGTFTGGTGIYHGAIGRFTFTVGIDPGATVGTGYVDGTVRY